MSSAPEWWFYLTSVVIVAGMIIAVIRTRIASSQEKTDRQRLSDEQFKMGVELLGKSQMAVRVGGVYVLEDLAKLEPELNHVRVMDVFASFLAYPPRYGSGPNEEKVDFDSADTVAIMKAIGRRTDEQKKEEEDSDYSLQRKLMPTAFQLVDGKVEINRANVDQGYVTPIAPGYRRRRD